MTGSQVTAAANKERMGWAKARNQELRISWNAVQLNRAWNRGSRDWKSIARQRATIALRKGKLE